MDKQKLITLLKEYVWYKAIGNQEIVHSIKYFRQISIEIYNTTGQQLHQDTIRNFYTGKHISRLETLDIFSKYVLSDNDAYTSKNFSDFKTEVKIKKPFQTKLFGNRIFLLLILILAVVIVIMVNKRPTIIAEATPYFSHRLNCSDIDCLGNLGWVITNFDSASWDKNKSKEYLTLLTIEGDSWLDDRRHTATVHNIVKHKLPIHDLVIELTLIDFNPYQRYQQAGFFLFFEEGTEVPSLRMTYANADTINKIQGVFRQSNHTNIDLLEDRIDRATISSSKSYQFDCIDSITLRLEVDQKEFSFARKINDQKLIYIKTVNLNVKNVPKYIGLAAFQGYPTLPPSLPPADIIPAQFSGISVLPLEN